MLWFSLSGGSAIVGYDLFQAWTIEHFVPLYIFFIPLHLQGAFFKYNTLRFQVAFCWNYDYS